MVDKFSRYKVRERKIFTITKGNKVSEWHQRSQNCFIVIFPAWRKEKHFELTMICADNAWCCRVCAQRLLYIPWKVGKSSKAPHLLFIQVVCGVRRGTDSFGWLFTLYVPSPDKWCMQTFTCIVCKFNPSMVVEKGIPPVCEIFLVKRRQGLYQKKYR